MATPPEPDHTTGPAIAAADATGDAATVPSEWTEVNITPNPGEPKERLLLDVVDPLIHDALHGRIGDWHYFWEPDLRLRIRWKEPTQDNLNKLTVFLAAAQADRKFKKREYGSHGVLGQIYPGEPEKFGDDIWPYTYSHWTTGCELALALVKRDPGNALTTFRFHHWTNAVHLFSNPLGIGLFGEGQWSVMQAHFYLTEVAKNLKVVEDPRVAKLLSGLKTSYDEIPGVFENAVAEIKGKIPREHESS
jgi:hypothetical protein